MNWNGLAEEVPETAVAPKEVYVYKRDTGNHLGSNLLILRGHDSISSSAPPGDVGRHEGWAAGGALGGPMLAIEDVKLYGTRLASAVAGTSFPVAVM